MKKIKLLTTLIVLTVVSSLYFISCKKDNKLINESQDSVNSSQSSVEYYENPGNTMDYIGALHNDGLDYVLTNLNSIPPFDSTLLIIDNSIYYGVNTLLQNQNDIEDLMSDFETTFTNELTIASDSVELAIHNTIDNNSLFSSTEKSYYHLTMYTLLSDNITDKIDMIDSIISIESNILSDLLLSTSQKNKLLAFTSTIRHSIHYWDQVGTGNFWPDFVPDDNYIPSGIKLREWWKKASSAIGRAFKVAATDVITYLTIDQVLPDETIITVTVLKSAMAGI